MKCLLLIDIQNDFLPGGALAVPGGDEILPVVNQLQQHFEFVVATQDWHLAGHKSFASSHNGKQLFDQINLDGLNQVLWPDHCVQSTNGAAFSPALNTDRVEVIFRKGTDVGIDSYSAFYDNGHRKSTSLAAFLRAKKISEIYLAGLAGDYCVYYSAKDALKEGFIVTIVEDAVRSIDESRYQEIKHELQRAGGRFINSADI